MFSHRLSCGRMAERGARPQVPAWRRRALRAVRSLFTPLLPDDYLELINPLWSTQELRGRIERIEPRDGRRGHVVDPARARSGPGHEPGPVPADRRGRRRRPPLARLLADLGPRPPRRLHRDHPEARRRGQGLALPRPQRRAPGTIVRLGGVEGTFVLPDPLPRAAALHQRRQRHHADHEHAARPRPRRRARRRRPPPLGAHAGRRDLRRRAARARTRADAGFRLHVQLTGEHGRIAPADLDGLCPDWRERETFARGPGEMLDALVEHWEQRGRPGAPAHGALPADHRLGDAERGEGGTIRFATQRRRGATATAATPILVAGEEAGADAAVRLPHGDLPHLRRPAVLRPGARPAHRRRSHGSSGEMVRTCVNAPEGAVEIAL